MVWLEGEATLDQVLVSMEGEDRSEEGEEVTGGSHFGFEDRNLEVFLLGMEVFLKGELNR
jgi:hypothetical protein